MYTPFSYFVFTHISYFFAVLSFLLFSPVVPLCFALCLYPRNIYSVAFYISLSFEVLTDCIDVCGAHIDIFTTVLCYTVLFSFVTTAPRSIIAYSRHFNFFVTFDRQNILFI